MAHGILDDETTVPEIFQNIYLALRHGGYAIVTMKESNNDKYADTWEDMELQLKWEKQHDKVLIDDRMPPEIDDEKKKTRILAFKK